MDLGFLKYLRRLLNHMPKQQNDNNGASLGNVWDKLDEKLDTFEKKLTKK